MALQGLNCLWCGAPLQKEGDGYFCKHCERSYKDDGIEQAYRRLSEGIEAQFGSAISDAQRKEKEERFYALRSNLWEKSARAFGFACCRAYAHSPGDEGIAYLPCACSFGVL